MDFVPQVDNLVPVGEGFPSDGAIHTMLLSQLKRNIHITKKSKVIVISKICKAQIGSNENCPTPNAALWPEIENPNKKKKEKKLYQIFTSILKNPGTSIQQI